MDDHDTGALDGTTDAVKPSTIKSIASEARDLAIMAARREGLTVGTWMERVIRQATAGEFAADRQGRPMSDRSLTTVSQGQPSRSDVSDLSQLVQLARDLSPSPDDSLMRLARTTVRNRLKAFRVANSG